MAAQPRVVSEDLRLALQFIATLEHPRESWAAKFDSWAAEQHIGDELARAVRIQIIRLRTFNSLERAARRRRRA